MWQSCGDQEQKYNLRQVIISVMRKQNKSTIDNKRYLQWVRLHLDVMNWLNSTRSPNLLAWMDCRRSCKGDISVEFKTSRVVDEQAIKNGMCCGIQCKNDNVRSCVNLTREICVGYFIDVFYWMLSCTSTQYWHITIRIWTISHQKWYVIVYKVLLTSSADFSVLKNA